MQNIDNTTLYQATIYIVDDNEELAKALGLILQQESYTVKHYTNAKDFLTAYSSKNLSCLLLDVRMPDMSGDELQTELLNRKINIPIVFISGYSDVPVIVDTLKKGAIDFLSKPIATTLQAVASLTEREFEIMQLIVQGKLNKTIAYDLDISTNTVENHRAKIMRKLQVKTIAELVSLCLLNGFLDLENKPSG